MILISWARITLAFIIGAVTVLPLIVIGMVLMIVVIGGQLALMGIFPRRPEPADPNILINRCWALYRYVLQTIAGTRDRPEASRGP